MEIAADNSDKFHPLLDPAFKNIVYIGRGGADMHNAVSALFKTFKERVNADQAFFNQLKIYFIGTSYAPAGQGAPTITPLAKDYNVEGNVIEITDRISYYHTLLTLQQADALFIPGSDDPNYTASKIYPYLLTNKPLLALFNKSSPALRQLEEFNVQFSFNYDDADVTDNIRNFLIQVANSTLKTPSYNREAIEKYSAENITRQQCLLFNSVINK